MICYLTDGIIEPLNAGVSLFGSLLAHCDPGYDTPVLVSATIDNVSMETSFVLSLCDCAWGEYFYRLFGGHWRISELSPTAVECPREKS